MSKKKSEPRLKKTKHDTCFKAIFSVPEYFAAFLRDQLPPEICAEFADGPPELIEKSFITKHLRQCHCDLLYRVRLKSGGYLYVLLEHKFKPDSEIFTQLLGYLLETFRYYMGKNKRGGQVRPYVLSFIIYNGKKRWNMPERFSGQLGDSGTLASLAKDELDFHPKLIDLSRMAPETLSTHPEFCAMLAVLRGDPGKEEYEPLLAYIAENLPISRDEPRVEIATEVTLNYMSSRWNKEARELLDQQLPLAQGEEGDDFVATYDEVYGRRFFNKGMAKGKAETLIKLLRQRFGSLSKEVKARITRASIDELDVWTGRVLPAESLDAVFADDS